MRLTEIFKKTNQMEFFQDEKGLHKFRGEIPSDFHIPQNEFLAGFQYLGKIAKADKNFDWLPFDLNLICPIFTDFDSIYLDYSNPSEPKILYPENSGEITSAYDELTQDSKIVYEQKRFSIRELDGINDDNEFEIFGITGKPQPNFDDEPVKVPRCPKTNNKMKFVTQLFSNEHIKYENKNFNSDDEYYENLFQTLNFWCDGSLLIFMEPSSRVVYYSISNT